MDASGIESLLKKLTDTFTERLHQDGIGEFAPAPPQLFHYTSDEGLKGIIERDVIWSTNYRYVNDLTEIIYANDILRDEILARLASANPLIHAVLDAVLNTPDLLVGAVDVFIACFCEEGDLLSQWRAYGGRGGGYAIGYRDIAIRSKHFGLAYNLYRVNYEEAQQREIIRHLLDLFCGAVEQLGTGINPATIDSPVLYSKVDVDKGDVTIESSLPEPLGTLCWCLATAFIRVACCFKNPNFAIEKEWRIVLFGLSERSAVPYNLKLRTLGATIIPYVELPLFTKDHPTRPGERDSNFSIEKIVYGPGLNPQVTERSIQYLTAKFPQAVPTEPSRIRAKV